MQGSCSVVVVTGVGGDGARVVQLRDSDVTMLYSVGVVTGVGGGGASER